MCNFWNSCRNMTVLKFGQLLRIRCPWSENELNFEPLGEREYMCHFLNFGQWPSMQISCPNMAILKISYYIVTHCPYIKNMFNQFRRPGIELVCHYFWNFDPWPRWLLSRAPRPTGASCFWLGSYGRHDCISFQDSKEVREGERN